MGGGLGEEGADLLFPRFSPVTGSETRTVSFRHYDENVLLEVKVISINNTTDPSRHKGCDYRFMCRGERLGRVTENNQTGR